MAFLPENYKAPTSGNYTKFEKGQTKLRILSDAYTFRQDWKDGKPVNTLHRMPDIGEPQKFDPTKPNVPKEIRSFIVWNYNTSSIEVCTIHQKIIKNGIMSLYQDQDRGDPKEYDISITKSGDSNKTDYQIMPGKQAPISKEVSVEYNKYAYKMDEFLHGGAVMTLKGDHKEDLPS